MADDSIITNGNSLATFRILNHPTEEELNGAAAEIVEALHQIAIKDGWRLEGMPTAQLITSKDEAHAAFGQSRESHSQILAALERGASIVVVSQDVASPALPTGGVIGSSIVRQTRERLALAKVLEHPGESGRARENAIHDHIASALPGGVRLETGFVIDAVGGQSRQIDLILYWDDYYPVFRVNGISLVPVEAAIAVFEVKANVDSRRVLRDCYEVLASVKKLDRGNRFANKVRDGSFAHEVPNDRFQDFQFQVLGAVVAERSITSGTWLEETRSWCSRHPRSEWPNFFISSASYVGTYECDNGGGTEVSTDPTAASRLAALEGSNVQDPLAFLSHEVVNFLRVSVKLDFSPIDYFGGSHNLGIRTMEFDHR